MTKSKFSGVRRFWSFHPPIAGIRSALIVILGLAILPSVAHAEYRSNFWTDYMVHASRCQDAINDAIPEGTRCLLGNGLNLVLDEGLRFADAYGKRSFGHHFQVAGTLRYSPVASRFGIEGDVDMVLPFSGAGIPVGGQGASSFFLQQGVTRSWDSTGSGLFRNDLRQGVVRRFWLSRTAGADILGISAFHLFNIERGHRVVAPGIDYTGRWGTGSLRYFIPTTGWRPGSPGYEERALEGLELGVRVALTTTLRLNTVGYRWRAEDGSDAWNTGARIELDWRPHPWLRLGATRDGIGGGEDSTTFQVAVHVPFGGQSKRPPWEGLGVAAGGSEPSENDLWRPVEDIGPIKVTKRKTASELVEEASFRFVDNTVGSGGVVQLEVLLSSPAPEDIRVVVRLVPGGGDNPAVAGEDYVDEAVETTIPEGATSTTVSFQLLQNDDMQEARSLSASVTVGS